MAGIDDDHITPHDLDDWPLLCDEVTFVAGYARTEPAALELILDQLHLGWTRWRFAKFDYEWVRADLSGDLREHLIRFFWRRYASVRHEVDHINNCAVRTGAGIVNIRVDDKGNAKPVFNSRCRLTMRATLIRLYHPDIVRGLQRIRLISPLSLVPTTPPPTTCPRQGEPPAGSREKWDPQAEWSIEMVVANLDLGQRQTKAMTAIIEACRQLPGRPRYKGKSRPEILDNISAADLHRVVAENASRDSCERFLAAWKAFRNRSATSPQ